MFAGGATTQLGGVASHPAAAKEAAAAKGAAGAATGTGAAQPPADGAARSAKGGRQSGPVGRSLQNAYADLMTPEEQAAHRTKVKAMKTYDECRSLFEATNKEMEVRAKAQNKTLKASPAELCDRAKERGRVTG